MIYKLEKSSIDFKIGTNVIGAGCKNDTHVSTIWHWFSSYFNDSVYVLVSLMILNVGL